MTTNQRIPSLTVDRLREALRYEPATGAFFWKVKASKNTIVGSIAGGVCRDSKGYAIIRLDGQLHRAHRLVWLYVYGKFPDQQIDHINRIRDDNRICNLREATGSQNNANKLPTHPDGLKGVRWHSAHKKWQAYISIDNKQKHLGSFSSRSAAIAARAAAARVRFGEFTREVVNG